MPQVTAVNDMVPATPLAAPMVAVSGVPLFQVALAEPFHQLPPSHVPPPSCAPVVPVLESHVKAAALTRVTIAGNVKASKSRLARSGRGRVRTAGSRLREGVGFGRIGLGLQVIGLNLYPFRCNDKCCTSSELVIHENLNYLLGIFISPLMVRKNHT